MIQFLNRMGKDYINYHMDTIKDAAYAMFDDYAKDDELDDLFNAESDWYREYLFP